MNGRIYSGDRIRDELDETSPARLCSKVGRAIDCPPCGAEARIIAFIIDHDVVDAILKHLAKAETQSPRGPPGAAALASGL